MNASVLIPCRGRPAQLEKSISALFSLALLPDFIEVIVRADFCDPELSAIIKVCSGRKNVRVIVGSRLGGYRDCHRFIEDCARLSSGAVMVIYNDDMEMLSQDWDSIYFRALDGGASLKPASSTISSPNQDGWHYKWACTVISRKLYNAVGFEACLGGNPIVDRCWDAFSKYAGEVESGVRIMHHRLEPGDGQKDRSEFYKENSRAGEKNAAEWDNVGRMAAARVKEKNL